MSKQEDGGSAFPSLHTIDGNWNKQPDPTYMGMSLRDYFAAAALGGMFAADTENNVMSAERKAFCAYAVADAMLKERAK